MKIAIVGTGAMGAVYAALLTKSGHEVWAIDLWREHLDAIDRGGLRVSGASGSYVVDGIRTAGTPEEVGPCDLWLVATKAADVDEVGALGLQDAAAADRGIGVETDAFAIPRVR